MQLDPDQREWLYQEEQERLRWKRKLQRQPGKYQRWLPAAIACVMLLLIVTAIVTSDSFAELISKARR
jgi:hypothetical protein